MAQYTVKIEASNEDGTIWQAVHPAETVEAASARTAARDTAINQTIVDGGKWRVVVWEGADADEGSAPALIAVAHASGDDWVLAYYAPESCHEGAPRLLKVGQTYSEEEILHILNGS